MGAACPIDLHDRPRPAPALSSARISRSRASRPRARALDRMPGGPALHALGAAVGAPPARRGRGARLRGGARGDRHPGAARARLLPAQPGGAGRVAARALGARADRRARALRAPRHPISRRASGRARRRGRGRRRAHRGALARRGAGGLPRLHRHHRAREHGRAGNADRLALRAARAALREGGTNLKDGRFTNFLPVRVVADLDVEAHIFAPSLTYGVTPDFDVNLTVPLVRTALDVTADTEVPDPRLPQFAVPAGPTRGSRSLSDSAFGVGDILLRAKYILRRERPFDVAAGLGLRLPSGEVNNFQGSGTTRVQPTLIVSRIFADRFQPLVNIGMDLNADDVGRSVFRWAVGGTATLVGPLTGPLVFLGRD